jgi:NAD+ diphosphatase
MTAARWRSAVDRAAHRRTDREWLAAAWPRARVLVIDPSGRAPCAPAEEGSPVEAAGVSGVPSSAAMRLVFVAPDEAPEGERLFLGVDAEDTPFFAVVAEVAERPGVQTATLREVGAVLSERDAELLGTAAALVNWHATHRFAPPTGQETVVSAGGWLRVDGTGTHLFPRTDPAVIVLVHDGASGPGGRCLLGSNAARPVGRDGRRFFSTLAGFVEPGESAEAAVAREVYEEVGVRVSGLRYVGSQPWPFPGSLMLGFTGLADAEQPLKLDPSEIAEARWFSREQLAPVLASRPDPRGFVRGMAAPGGPVNLPGPASIAHRLIRLWFDGPTVSRRGRP